MCFGSLMTSGLITLGKENHAQGNAIFNTLQQFSGALGTALAETLIALAQNKYLTNGTAVGSKWTFMVLLILIIINLLLALAFVPKKK
jgi:MFS family major facilitator transporter